MNVMVLDAEYNQPSGKTIQIGAAVFNCRNAALIARLELYVNPGEPITPEITQLTGITDKDVESAIDIKQAYEELKDFHKQHKCFRNPLVWGSGVRNDSLHIYNEYVAYMKSFDVDQEPDAENFMGFRVLDVKTIYQSTALFENSQYSGGLKDIMKRLGLTFEGEPHRALTDAVNTFRVWYHLMRTFHDGRQKKKT